MVREGQCGSSKRSRDESGSGGQLLLTGPSADNPVVVGAALQADAVGSPAPKRAVGLRPGFLIGLVALLGIVLL